MVNWVTDAGLSMVFSSVSCFVLCCPELAVNHPFHDTSSPYRAHRKFVYKIPAVCTPWYSIITSYALMWHLLSVPAWCYSYGSWVWKPSVELASLITKIVFRIIIKIEALLCKLYSWFDDNRTWHEWSNFVYIILCARHVHCARQWISSFFTIKLQDNACKISAFDDGVDESFWE